MADLGFETREQVVRYLTGKLDLAALNLWIGEREWAIEDDSACDGESRLVHEVAHRIAELTSGHRTEEELRLLLEDAVHTPYHVHAPGTLPARHSDSLSRSVRSDLLVFPVLMTWGEPTVAETAGAAASAVQL